VAFPRLLALVAILLALAAPSAQAQKIPSNLEYQIYPMDTGIHANKSLGTHLAYESVITAFGHPGKVRVQFSGFELGVHSYLTLTSLADGGKQTLDAISIRYWQGTSAIFNGDQVRLQLFVAPGEQGIYATVSQLLLECDCPSPALNVSAEGLPKTLCGVDSRAASTDNRVGRISGCTAWLVSNGAVLTAGHCGPVSGVFEVNVPSSSASGTTVAAAPEDQYPIDTSNRTSVDNGNGDDYTVFALLPNTSTGTRAHLRFGFFRMTREAPAAGATIRITGFGVDNTPAGPVANCCATDSNGMCTHPNCNAQSRTLQTATGPFVNETGSGSVVAHNYQTDSEPANSGSPIIWNANGFTIGIHTHGGCTSGGGGSNSGTSFENNNLESLLQNFPGSNTKYVDSVTYPNAPTENGTVFQPFNTVTEGVASVVSGGRVCIVEGSYTAAAGNTLTMGADGKSFALLAPVGTVTIGN
jgi:V8-like Glu-specific endopeptidase